MEKYKLEEFNHWWVRRKVDEDLALPFKRDVYTEIEKSLEKRFILALTGLRRIGKTTIIYQLIQKLLKENVNSENILFFSFDETSVKLKEVFLAYNEIHSKDFRNERVYIFLDEIQKCENWQNELKKYYDLYPKIKFVISGSESLFIKKKTKENLAGRIFEYILTPLLFKEYLAINKIKENEFKYETKIKPVFLKYMNRGGFPETINLENEREFKEYIRNLVVDKIIYKDIPKIFKIEDPEFLIILLELIATNPGLYLDYQSLSKQFGKDRRVIKDYIIYLRESFLIRLLGNYRKGSFSSLRKMKRVYCTDNALTYLYKTQIDESFFGRMVENAVINKIKAVSFWKNRGEIDVVYEGFPIEVKYQEKINVEDFKTIKEFMKKFNVNKGFMITKNDENEIKTDEGIIKLIPAWRWFLN